MLPETPLSGLCLRVDPVALGELLMEMEDDRAPPEMVRGLFDAADRRS